MLILAATTQRYIFFAVAAVVMIAFVVYLYFNIFRSGTAEIGSEIELAPNRKPYYDDEDMEAKRLDRSLVAGVGTLAVVALSLPLYWLGEPGRQDGREEFTADQFSRRGAELYEANCVNCHAAGAVGGVAPYTKLDDQGLFVAQSDWQAPALTTVLQRYSRDEVFDILQYGRPQSPMPAWGSLGGGPMTDQRLEEVIEYLSRIQLDKPTSTERAHEGALNGIEAQIRDANRDIFDPPAEDATDAEKEAFDAAASDRYGALNATVPGLGDLREREAELRLLLSDEDPGNDDQALDGLVAEPDGVQFRISELLNAHYDGLSIEEQGDLLFNNTADAGSYGCARCHTGGSSWDADGEIAERPELEGLITAEVPGGGGFGPSLIGVDTQFSSASEQEAFITAGCNIGDQYGLNGFCDGGQMPGYGGVLSTDQIAAIVAYERGLG